MRRPSRTQSRRCVRASGRWTGPAACASPPAPPGLPAMAAAAATPCHRVAAAASRARCSPAVAAPGRRGADSAHCRGASIASAEQEGAE